MDGLAEIRSANLGWLLNRLDDPLFLIDRNRAILFLNAAAEQVLETDLGLAVRRGRLTFSTATAASWLDHMTHVEYPGSPMQRACSGLRLSCRRTSSDWLVVFAAMSQGGVHSAALFAVHLIGQRRPWRVPVQVLHDLFGLTRTETELVASLVRNEKLREIANRMAISHETARAQLKLIFGKCAVRSRGELLALVHRISLVAT